ncbi:MULTISPECIES: hypothetical protein [Burkholderiaceae]|uniref:Uncharacterized protein n=1 Tax=Paraburkholderia aromaticivorans TaxID=2026199 RepID=A0A248VZR0_9BURK|nr:hypothetical protein [Paraburkholderia aromaticivorans]ASW04345.1 hypothetical protein CJU94_40095 [Paraburkholderia aromaticivorans]
MNRASADYCNVSANGFAPHEWQNPIASDLSGVAQLLELALPSAATFARPLVRSAIVSEDLLASSLLVLCAHEVAGTVPLVPAVQVFAAAMELIIISLNAHALLPDGELAMESSPLLALGSAAGVLLGDLLYTHAFRMIVQTREANAIQLVAKATEEMVKGATRERFPANGQMASCDDVLGARLAATYGACCRIGGLLGGASSSQLDAMQRLGAECGRLKSGAVNSDARRGNVHASPVGKQRLDIQLRICETHADHAVSHPIYRDVMAALLCHAAGPSFDRVAQVAPG